MKKGTQREPATLMVDTQTACEVLGVGSAYMTQVKTEMGIKGAKRFFLEDVIDHIQSRLRRQQDRQPATAGKNDARLSRRALKAA